LTGAGVYTFDGVVVEGFDPAVAGSFTFVYTETTAFGCVASCEFVIVVNPLPVFDCPAYGQFCEGDEAVMFEGAGVYTFDGVVVKVLIQLLLVPSPLFTPKLLPLAVLQAVSL
jgi:hypothetical protein